MRFFITILCCITLQSYAGVIKVGSQQSYKTVTSAIAVANIGDTVLVEQGVYYEKNLIINKPIVLKGINRPVLDAEKQYENISIKADNVTVEGFLFQHTGVSSLSLIHI